MDILEAIHGRRTVHDFTNQPVTKDQIETMLEAAIWAPNHKLTNPWEFYVMSGAVKERLADLRGRLKQSKHQEPDSEAGRKSYANAHRELATVPYALVVCQKPEEDPVKREEDLLSIGCAIQNLMLAAYGMGIGTFWGTGPLLHHPETFAALGIPSDRRGIGLVLIGVAAHGPKVPARAPLAAHVKWAQ